MLALCSMLSDTYYAHNYASIIGGSLNSDVTSSTGELSFFDTVSSEVSVVHGGSQPWTVVLGLNSSQTEFKIDTGADITVVPEHV